MYEKGIVGRRILDVLSERSGFCAALDLFFLVGLVEIGKMK